MMGWLSKGLEYLASIGGVAAIAWMVRRYIDSRLETKLAAYKSGLDRQADLVRHELQREMVQVQLSANQVHGIYPRLFAKLQRTDGAITSLLGARFAASYEGYDRADIEATVVGLKLPGEMRDRLLRVFDADRDEGIAELKRLVRRVEILDARRVFTRAKNYLFLKSLYISPEVKTGAQRMLDAAWKAWVDVDVGEMPGNAAGTDVESFNRQVGILRNELDALEELMRRELKPR